MKANRLTRLSVAIGLSLATSTALASPQQFLSSRSFAMGGTDVAVAHPASAGMTNPAMLAADHHQWSDDFGLILPSVNARFADEEETIDQIDDIQNTIDLVEQSANNADVSGTRNAAGLLKNQLDGLNRDTMRGDAGVGVGLAFPSSSSLSVGFFTSASLRATVRGNVTDNDLQQLEAIENGTVDALVGGRNIGDRLTSDGTVLASAVAEAGISFAKRFELANEQQLQVGISPKYVQMRTFEYVQAVSDFEDDDFDADENETKDSGFNVDLGAVYTFGEEHQWNAGAVVRNVIPMDLESVSGREMTLDPLVTVGIAHHGDLHVLTAELDLTEKEAFGYEDDTQWLAVGAEFDAFRYMQLRAGVRQNLASNDDNDGIEEKTQFTAGIGLAPFGARLDIGALISDSEVGAAIELGAAF